MQAKIFQKFQKSRQLVSSSALFTSIIFMSASRVSTLKNSSLQFIGLYMIRTRLARWYNLERLPLNIQGGSFEILSTWVRLRPGRPDYIHLLVKLPKINHSSNVENINNLLVSKQAVRELPSVGRPESP